MAAKYKIRSDYRAIRNSGHRDLPLIRQFVLHDIESTNKNGAAEGAGAWFENRAVQASTNYGCDNNSIQRYLPVDIIPWGAPGVNTSGIHIEMMGVARWDEEDWFKNAKPTMDRAAWLMARVHRYLAKKGVAVPLRRMSDNELRGNHRGIITHRQATRALGVGTHTDPGPGFPLNWVIRRARYYHDHPAML